MDEVAEEIGRAGEGFGFGGTVGAFPPLVKAGGGHLNDLPVKGFGPKAKHLIRL